MRHPYLAIGALAVACLVCGGLAIAQAAAPGGGAGAPRGRGPGTRPATSGPATNPRVYALNRISPLLAKPPMRPADWLVEHDPVTPNASPEARALLKYFYSISLKHTLTGQHNFPFQQEISTNAALRNSGKTPTIYGSDWGFAQAGDKDSAYSRDATVAELIKQWHAGHIIVMCWHAVRPTEDEPVTFMGSVRQTLTDAEWNQLVTPGSDLNKHWLAQVDVIAGYLKKLQDAHVPILWRPFHEMNLDAFWWSGRRGETGTKELYRMIFDRLVNYHKLNNLIWIWNCDRPEGTDRQFVDYFPGQQYFDILTLDCYAAFNQRYYDEMNALSDGKVMAVSETGNVPPLATYQTQPKWTYYMCWAGSGPGGGGGGGGGRARGPATSASIAPASQPATPARAGGGRGNATDYATIMSDPRLFNLEDPAYWESIADLRKACGLPAARP